MGSGVSSSAKMVVLSHSSQVDTVRRILGVNAAVPIVTELFPINIQSRYALLQQCELAIVAMDVYFQFSDVLLTSLSFLKDSRKTIQSASVDSYFEPSGAIGAICFGYGTWVPSLHDNVHALQQLVAAGAWLPLPDMPEPALPPIVPDTLMHDVCILFEGDVGKTVAAFLTTLASQGLAMPERCSVADANDSTALEGMTSAKLVLCVITESSATSPAYQRALEVALVSKKCLLPINCCEHGGLTGWLGLAFAGRLWYPLRPSHLDGIFTKYAEIDASPCCVSDSCTASDLLAYVHSALVDECHLFTTEEARLMAYEAAVLQDRQARAAAMGLSAAPVPLMPDRWQWTADTQLPRLNIASFVPSSVITDTVQYTVTRLSLAPPPAIVDAHGLPRASVQIDAMFSYAWKQQSAVLQLYQQGSVAHLRVWMDVMGYMKGNIYAAMATAVSSVGAVLICLSAAYIASINCKLEFLYAAHCRTPMLFLIFDDVDLTALPDWITAVTGGPLPLYPATDSDRNHLFAIRYNQAGAQGILFSLLRSLAAAHASAPPRMCRDGTLGLAHATSWFREALLAHETSSMERCRRCDAPFSPTAPTRSCRVHAAYYMGGTLLPGHWVCCNEPKKDGIGCEAADHTTLEQIWCCDTRYGTYTWQPVARE
ncbi:hypothetical protein SPRG_07562 [Saprolegnia parasitica CBS 223.65]|uniref:TIR domain-containing protein n=1 Tax=Saprolegnia parasitica (strain CBS 223.65) TaxID=695850 RepID=A0A067CA01_SAPPC|nr:hypothetical protein SPRG_07562 [Saprolegnia parasitica CBS 223.65]KDO27313.1 hypothetical protein SPRG_07562 [Saprolegnia parasitica CBS 223.65]|eukprot:XP_012202086.1 hypothetical protein SPRG_07562 [Saprolegnia parasitica CBS 223.65]